MNKNHSEPIECPFCSKQSVSAKIGTTYYFVSEHPMYKDGADINGETMGEILGDMTSPMMKYIGFRCASCGKEWSVYDYKLIKDENGEFSFVKREKKTKKKVGELAEDKEDNTSE